MDPMGIAMCFLGLLAIVAAVVFALRLPKWREKKERNKELEKLVVRNVKMISELEDLVSDQRAALPAKSRKVVDQEIAVLDAKRARASA